MLGKTSFEFAGHVLNLRQGSLRKGGVDVALRPKSLSLLVYLVQNSGRVLGRDEIVAAIWPDVEVSDDSLTQCMKDIRKALGPEAGGLIRTVPRRGYIVDESRIRSLGDQPLTPVTLNAPSLPDKPSIAVLPFSNLSDNPGQEYFVDGMVEEIITALSRISWLFVIARNSSFTYKNHDLEAKQIGRELGVRYLLGGSVRRAADLVRISAQLVDASTGANLWADRFDGDMSNIFELQDRIAARVVGMISPRLEQAEIERAKRKPIASLDAYDYYLRGMSALHKFQRDANADAVSNLYRAIELDPEFAPAYGQLARCYAQRRGSGWVTDRKRDVAEATQLARRAIDLGKNDAVALCTAGFALADVADEVEDGDSYIDRALALNPNLAIAWLFSGCVKISLGDPEGAISRLLHAMRLSPQDPQIATMQAHLASAHFIAGRYEEACSWAEMAVRGKPTQLFATAIAAASSALAGRHTASQRMMQRLREAAPWLRLSNLKDVMSYLRPKDFKTWSEGLQKAGLPE
jgi:TolB-like protein/Tfp pilus assembly protein PilF